MTKPRPLPRFMIAAAHKSSGKTVISTGLGAALSRNDVQVQCFKKGPDYIDPMWLAAASGRPCYNLDFNTMSAGEIAGLLVRKSGDRDLALIESNKGLFDGVASDGADSNAALAKQLNTPVILVVDTTGTTRGIAPLLQGYQGFDPEVAIKGVILNKVGGARHEAKLRTAVETYTDLPVLGAVANHPDLDIGERHLGLTTPAETGELTKMINRFGNIIADSVDLAQIRHSAHSAPDIYAPTPPPILSRFDGLRIGVARDASFGFYYPDDLEMFQSLGARLIPFDTMTTAALPDIDGLFIGGGFPELQMKPLSENASLRDDIRRAVQNGLPTYGECGGLMYLCETLHWRGETWPMCGVIPGDAVMNDRPQGRGYTRFGPRPDQPWGPGKTDQPAHEFHYAQIDNLAPDTRFAREILRGHGVDGQHDGIVIHNLLAGFIHLRNSAKTPWVEQFLRFVEKTKQAQK